MMKALKKENIHIQNDFEDELVEEPNNIQFYYDEPSERYQVLFNVAVRALKGYKIFDYLLYNLAFTNSISSFELDLVNNNLYNQYTESVLNRDDDFLKAYMLVYLKGEDIEEYFGTKKNLASVFINDKEHGINFRLNGLMGLAQFKLDKDTINYIKENIVNMIYSIKDNEVAGPPLTEEIRQNLINTYYETIDLYQKDYNLSYTN